MASRGGRGGRGANMLKGATFEYDTEAKLDVEPNKTFPEHPGLRKQSSPTEREKKVLRNYRAIQSTVHAGPFYTHPTKRDLDAPAKTFSEDQFNKQYGVNAKADFDPFTGVDTYSKKYDPPKQTLPDLKRIKLDKKMFPKELWDVLEGESGEKIRADIAKAGEKKAAMLDAHATAMTGVVKAEPGETSKLLEKFSEEQEEEDDEPNSEEGEDEPEDDNFEEDEDGDYNGEKYFSGGEGEEEGDDGPGEEY